MRIYAMSDIHGCLGPLEERLGHLEALGFFEEGCEDELVLLGDYIDRGPHGLGVVREVMRLERECPGRVVALMGNHEDGFLTWLGEGAADWDDEVLLDDDVDELLGLLAPDFGPPSGQAPIDRLLTWRRFDAGGATMRSFLGAREYAAIEGALALVDDVAADTFERACGRIRAKRAAEVRWMRGLREYYETDRQVFVHAGIIESSGDMWPIATPRDTMLWDRSYRKGPFYKDVVAGHSAASRVAGDPTLRGVFWDGASHFYVDGMTIRSGIVPVLVYDSDDGRYWELDEDGKPKSIRQ